jgi:hypothetical protein
MGNKDGHRRIKFEFAVLLALVILTLWQIGESAWRSLSGLF